MRFSASRVRRSLRSWEPLLALGSDSGCIWVVGAAAVVADSEEVALGGVCCCFWEGLAGFSPKPLPEAKRAHGAGDCFCDIFDTTRLGK